MQHIPANGSETDAVNPTVTDVQLQAELDTLRHRLAAIEEKPRGQTNRGRSLRNVVAMLIAMAVLTVLANAPFVHGQSVVDALFISAEGNVGIGTTNPGSPLTIKSSTATALRIESPETGGYGLQQTSGQTSFQTWVSPGQANIGSTEKLLLVTKGVARVTISPEGNVGIGTSSPDAKLDVAGNVVVKGNMSAASVNAAKLDVAGDINVNNNRISSYKGFPTADFDTKCKMTVNLTCTYTHNFGTIPSLVQVWVRSDGTSDGPGITKTDQWKMAGILSLWEDGASYGTVVESIDENTIVVRTGITGLWHGHTAGDWFKSGEIWVRAWK